MRSTPKILWVKHKDSVGYVVKTPSNPIGK
jgi:hypothetical protein